MKIAINDRAAFESLHPTDVAAYLNTTGWREIDHRAGFSSTWQRAWKNESVELFMPLNRSIPDYVLRMAEAAKLIAAIEDRSELEVLTDLQIAGSDIIRVRFRFASAEDGSIPLERGEALIENAREMMLAGALRSGFAKALLRDAQAPAGSRFRAAPAHGPERAGQLCTHRPLAGATAAQDCSGYAVYVGTRSAL